ncbi:MAG: hypothetical protein AAF614_42415 [Chloroflexota bacterium]
MAFAAQAGYMRIVVNKGDSMRLLREAAARGIMPLYVGKFLTAFAGDEQGSSPLH